MKSVPLSVIALMLAGCGAAAPAPEEPEGPTSGEPPPTFAIALRLEDAGADENETPRTRVALVMIAPDGAREIAELRVELGACWHETTPDSMISARCWWGGAGARYEVHRDGGAVIARRAEIDEETGDTGVGRARFEEVGRVEVPPDAELHVVTPGGVRRAQRGSVTVMPVER